MLQKKQTPEIKVSNWWTQEVQQERKKLGALRRRFQAESNKEDREKHYTIYKRERAKYKKLIKQQKTKTWVKFCESAKNPYGPQYKIASGKSTRPARLVNTLPEGEEVTIEKTLTNFIETLYITDEKTPHVSVPAPPRFNENKPQPITKQELNRIIKNIKENKAPGYDYIDYNLTKRIHEAAPSLLLKLFNKCQELNHFPKSFKTGNVVLFHKEGKDPTNPKNYRPICLLPAFGKMLERVIHGRINHHLTKNNYWNPNQYGFKQGVSTENALDALLDKIKQDKTENYQTLLISIDIKGAFDSISWPKVISILRQSPTPTYLINWVLSFLEDRFVTMEENGIKVTRQTYGGCPQGSCLGPLLWLLIAETALNKNWGDHVRIQAFADDFMLVLRGETKEDLIELANKILKEFSDWADRYNLTINWEKTELLYLNRERTGNLPTSNSCKIEGITVNGKNIESKETIKYLGLTIQKNLNWQDHCEKQIKKVQNSFRLLGSMATRRWGLDPALIKLWYKTVVERTLVYAAPIWGHGLSQKCKEKLLSCQRQFALAIVKAYRTAPTSAILVLAGLIPVHLQVQYEATYGTLTRLQKHSKINDKPFQHTDYMQKINIWKRHPADTIEAKIHLDEKEIVIYTDGSKLESGATGSAFVAYKNDEKIHTWSAPLRQNNSVFQAELLAILEATDWGNHTGEGYSIRSDCSSAIHAINKPFNTDSLVERLHEKIEKSNNKFKISWVKAHVGIEGNEEADALAKQAAENSSNQTEKIIQKPISYLKRQLKIETKNQWQFEWDYGDTGRLTHKLFPNVTTERQISCRLLTQLYTGHGAFPAYLHRFRRKESPECACGALGDSLHYLIACPLTATNHLTKITTQNEKYWHNQLAHSKHIKEKAKRVVRWLTDNIDLISK